MFIKTTFTIYLCFQTFYLERFLTNLKSQLLDFNLTIINDFVDFACTVRTITGSVGLIYL